MIEEAISSPRRSLATRTRLATWPRRSRVSRRRCGAPFRTSRHQSSCRPSWRRYVWNSFSEFIGRAAQAQPLLLVLEDLHWADESTLLLTEYLAPLLPEMPVLVLGTYRDVEVDLQHPLARVIGQLGRRRLVERITCAGSPSTAYARCCRRWPGSQRLINWRG